MFLSGEGLILISAINLQEQNVWTLALVVFLVVCLIFIVVVKTVYALSPINEILPTVIFNIYSYLKSFFPH